MVEKFHAKLKATRGSPDKEAPDDRDDVGCAVLLESPAGLKAAVVFASLLSLALASVFAYLLFGSHSSGNALLPIVVVLPLVFFLVVGVEIFRLKRWARLVMVVVLWLVFIAIVLMSLWSFQPLSYGIDNIATANLPSVAKILARLAPLVVAGTLCFICLHFLGKHKRNFSGWPRSAIREKPPETKIPKS